jgi:chemotaxis protein CheD
MKPVVVGVGDCQLSADAEAQLVTYALGSCIAVTIWDPAARVGGLLHFMLPEAGAGREQEGAAQPYRYADTGTPLLFRGAYRMGADKKRLVVRLAGGAAVVNDGGLFNIGKRNYAAVRRILWQAGVMVAAEDVGGAISRTVRMDIGTGRQWIRTPDGGERELGGSAAGPRRPLGDGKGGVLCANGC